ncbi:MAG: hypothetical protein CMP07_12735 [Xanthomonadales bacterium]|nr:hypothetical protein [Xanthomonadales bacterium]
MEIVAAQKIGARFQCRLQVCIIDFPDFAANFNDIFSVYLADSVSLQKPRPIKHTRLSTG